MTKTLGMCVSVFAEVAKTKNDTTRLEKQINALERQLKQMSAAKKALFSNIDMPVWKRTRTRTYFTEPFPHRPLKCGLSRPHTAPAQDPSSRKRPDLFFKRQGDKQSSVKKSASRKVHPRGSSRKSRRPPVQFETSNLAEFTW